MTRPPEGAVEDEPVTVVVTFRGRAADAVRWLSGVQWAEGDPHCSWTWDRRMADRPPAPTAPSDVQP